VPELPEVETVRRGLAENLTGRTVTAVDVLHPRATRRQGADTDFGQVAGQRVDRIRRRGKYLWFALSSQDAVIAHLGMSGQFRFVPPGTAPHPHLRIRLVLAAEDLAAEDLAAEDLAAEDLAAEDLAAEDLAAEDLAAEERAAATHHLRPVTECWFLDQRTFGGMHVSPGGAELPTEVAHLGRDLLDPELDRTALVETIRRKHVGIKRVLLDQTVTSGIGNIYADEALWQARIHGERLADTLTRPKIGGLLDAVTQVFQAALVAGGTSFDSLYVNVNGESGYFDRSLNAYGQTGRPCPRCGTPIRRTSFMNRSSHFCPHCQPRPRTSGRATALGRLTPL